VHIVLSKLLTSPVSASRNPSPLMPLCRFAKRYLRGPLHKRAEDVWWYFGATLGQAPYPSAPMQRASLYCKDLIALLQTTVCFTAKSYLLYCKFTIHSSHERLALVYACERFCTGGMIF
jgi:hypothetical protein